MGVTLRVFFPLCLCAISAGAQLPDSVVRVRMDSASICPQVLVTNEPDTHSWNIATSPITSRVGGRDLAMVIGASFLPAGLGSMGMIQFMAMGEGPTRYAAAHDILILADDSIRIPVTARYSDNATRPNFHFETISGQIHSYDLARLAAAKRITVRLGTESHPLSAGQVQAVRALVRAMDEPLSAREVATGCTGPSRSALQAKWDAMNSETVRGTAPVVRRRPVTLADSAATYFEFQVTRPARVIDHGVMVYPADLKAARVSGRVLAQFVVLTNGKADMDTFKVMSSTNDRFTQVVAAAVPTMLFAPAEVNGTKVRQLVQLPFDFALRSLPSDTASAAPLLPPSASQTVYTESQVERPARTVNGSPIPKTVPPEVVAMIGGEVSLEFVVNADGTVDRSTIRVISSTDPVTADAVVKGFSMKFRPAEVGGRSVRQLVQMAMPVRTIPRP